MRDIIGTERLELRCFRPDDAADLHEIFCDPKTHTIGTGPISSLDRTEEWIERRILTYRETGLAWYGARLRDSGLLVGNCGVFAGRTGSAGPEIGYEVRRTHQGQGIAGEAARAVLDECSASGIARVWATIRPHNTASLQLAARLGMTVEYTRTDERGELLYLSRFSSQGPGSGTPESGTPDRP
ncbi:GNAT family N-acetyltransferase [Streptomyces sp. NBC_00876]|uniref:GNAT family N-acetyltransferase n=1 Tax=Streptomyces sp. NBC_00876 TaxID=2975853 RepID=UPI003863E9B2|nr:GNAT family N-acetyltransferase [Streptomyces sp. NBC_00876]